MTTFLYSVQQAKSPLIPKDTGDFAFVLLLNSGYTIKKEYNDEKTDKTILKEREDAHVPNGHYPAFYLIEPDYGILLLPEFNSSNLINHEKKSRKPREIAVFYLQLFRVNGIIY